MKQRIKAKRSGVTSGQSLVKSLGPLIPLNVETERTQTKAKNASGHSYSLIQELRCPLKYSGPVFLRIYIFPIFRCTNLFADRSYDHNDRFRRPLPTPTTHPGWCKIPLDLANYPELKNVASSTTFYYKYYKFYYYSLKES